MGELVRPRIYRIALGPEKRGVIRGRKDKRATGKIGSEDGI